MYLNSVMSQQLLLCLSVLLVSFYVASPKKVSPNEILKKSKLDDVDKKTRGGFGISEDCFETNVCPEGTVKQTATTPCGQELAVCLKCAVDRLGLGPCDPVCSQVQTVKDINGCPAEICVRKPCPVLPPKSSSLFEDLEVTHDECGCLIYNTSVNKNPCQHGATFTDYKCDCVLGYSGKDCQVDETQLDECLSNPCQNGGNCVDKIGGYFCKCKLAFKGSNCEDVAHPDLLGGMASRGSSQYVIVTSRKTWLKAREHCRALGGDLAAVETEEEWRHVYDQVKAVDGDEYHWLGGRIAGDGVWRWVTGNKISLKHKAWFTTHPIFPYSHPCLILGHPNYPGYYGADGHTITNVWYSLPCGKTHNFYSERFICEV